ncbi:putative rhamnosyltransferase domain protein, partial [Escherichia coli P0301867.8]
MSSGSLTKVDVFKKIGLFDEDLFIDYVDYEWGWRALEKNF